MIYYIYTLTDPNTNEIKYIGKTNNIKNRLKRHLLPSNLKNKWTAKTKWLIHLKQNNQKPIIEILDIDIKYNINDLEIYWISQFRTWGFNLTNETNGGDGFDWTGKKHKKKSINKMKMNHPLRKVVIQYDIKTNNFICKFNSLHEASEKTKLCRNHISRCCKGQKGFNTVGGYFFRFENEYFPLKKNKYNNIKLYQYNLDLELINTFNSYKDANNNGFCHDTIRKVINSEKTYKNYYWKTL